MERACRLGRQHVRSAVLTTLDQTVFFSYLAIVLAIGLAATARGRGAFSAPSYFLANRSMGWLPIGLSVMVTAFSAINFIAMPSEVLGHGLYVVASLPVFLLVAFPVTRFFIPFFHRLNATTAYEYLGTRFSPEVRTLAAALFILWRIAWMAVALYAAGTLLAKVAGLPANAVIALAGLAALLYTSVGGIRAVMWTDVLQFFILITAIIAALFLAGAQLGSTPGLLEQLVKNGALRPFVPFDPAFLSFDPRIRITLWSALIGTSVAFLARYTADQAVVQRYFTAASARTAARGFWLNVAAALLAVSLLVLLGLATALWTLAHPTDAPLPAKAQLVRFLCALPPGFVGLVAAGLTAATMSSIDSGMNACAATFLSDLRRPNRKRDTAERKTPSPPRSPLIFTLAVGTIVILLSFHVGRLGSLFAVVNRIIHGLGSPLLALFLIGILTRISNSRGVFIGAILGTIFSIATCLFLSPLALHHYATLNLVGTVLLIVVCTRFLPEGRKLAPTCG